MDGISAAERQPIYPEGGPKDNETYAEDGSGKDDIDTEDGSREHGYDRKGGGVSIRTSLMKGWFKNILQVHKRNE